jgi:hypothetical protein
MSDFVILFVSAAGFATVWLVSKQWSERGKVVSAEDYEHFVDDTETEHAALNAKIKTLSEREVVVDLSAIERKILNHDSVLTNHATVLKSQDELLKKHGDKLTNLEMRAVGVRK